MQNPIKAESNQKVLQAGTLVATQKKLMYYRVCKGSFPLKPVFGKVATKTGQEE